MCTKSTRVESKFHDRGLTNLLRADLLAYDIYSFYKSEDSTLKSKWYGVTKPTKNWGPISDEVRKHWLEQCKTTSTLEEEQLIINNSTTSD